MGVALLLLSSCKKEGCTDSDAVNFEEEAKKDDGSCEYEGNVLLWTDCDWCCELEVRIDGEYQGNTTLWYTSEPFAPNCKASGCISATLPVGTYEWSATEVCVGAVAVGFFTIDANGCTKVVM